MNEADRKNDGSCVVLIAAAPVALAQDRPGEPATQAVESIVTVRAVNPDDAHGHRGTPRRQARHPIQVPPEAHNLDGEVQPGNKFRVRYLESVAIDVLDPGTEANTGAVQIVGTRTQGCNAGRSDRECQASRGPQVEEVDYANRTVVVSGPQGKRQVQGGPGGQAPQTASTGYLIRVRYTEALALEMVQP